VIRQGVKPAGGIVPGEIDNDVMPDLVQEDVIVEIVRVRVQPEDVDGIVGWVRIGPVVAPRHPIERQERRGGDGRVHGAEKLK
jgi:hypothetical protein